MTLVELMIALVVSSLIIFFLFSVQSKMSNAYQAQSTVSDINHALQAGRQRLAREIRMAGFGLANAGTNTAVSVADGVDAAGFLQGLTVFNNFYGDGNDTFRILYTDPAGELVVTGMSPNPVFAKTAEPSGFSPGAPIIIAARSAACLVVVTAGTNTNMVHFNPTPAAAPYNAPHNDHCLGVLAAVEAGESVTIRRLVARSYRIDPTRPGQAFLQMSPSGEVIADDWIDMGVGFTNLQLASRYFEAGDAVDADGDDDPERDWYSSDNQVRPGSVLLQVSLSIEARSPYGTRGAAASIATPAFIDMANVDNNSIGDWGQACPNSATDPCGIDLASTPDADRPNRYKGEYIYRHSSTQIDLRNMGVGR